jgi:septum formation protein
MTSASIDCSLILASGSASRRSLLERLRLPFEVLPANLDETPRADETPAALVERLSRSKARAVAERYPDSVVIGSDQVAVFEGRPSGKPGGPVRARELLRRFSGREVDFLTGACVRQGASSFEGYFMDCTRVRFRALEDQEIERYLECDQPWDCAGSFRLESLGPSLFESVESSDPTALLGLPLIGTCALLRRVGFHLP